MIPTVSYGSNFYGVLAYNNLKAERARAMCCERRALPASRTAASTLPTASTLSGSMPTVIPTSVNRSSIFRSLQHRRITFPTVRWPISPVNLWSAWVTTASRTSSSCTKIPDDGTCTSSRSGWTKRDTNCRTVST